MEKIKLFVYGLLKSGSIFYDTHLKSKVVEKHKAFTKANLYYLPNFSCPAICYGDGIVEGELLVFNDPGILKITDEFEEYYENSPDSSLFKRTKIEIFYENKEKDISFAYIMSKNDILKYGGMKIEKGSF